MAPSMLHMNQQLEKEWDLLKSMAEIANLTPIQFIQLLRSPEHEHKARKSLAHKYKTTKSMELQKRVTKSKCLSRKRKTQSRKTSVTKSVEHKDGIGMCLEHKAEHSSSCCPFWFINEKSNVNLQTTNSKVRDFGSFLPEPISLPIYQSYEPSDTCLVYPEYIDSQAVDTYGTESVCSSEIVYSSLEGSTQAPLVLPNELDYLNPDLVHTFTIKEEP